MTIRDDIVKKLEEYLVDSPYEFNSDTMTVNKVIVGLVKRFEKFGKLYCPCRLPKGNNDYLESIECPCKMHPEEIEENGICYCELLVKPPDSSCWQTL